MTDTTLKPGMMFTNEHGVWRVLDERDKDTGDLPQREIEVREATREAAQNDDTEWLTESEAVTDGMEIVDSMGYTKRDVAEATVITCIPYADGPEYHEYEATGDELPDLLMTMEDPEHCERVVDVDLTFSD